MPRRDSGPTDSREESIPSAVAHERSAGPLPLRGAARGLIGADISEEHVKALATGPATLPPQQRQILAGIFDATQLKVREILVPRIRTLRTPTGRALFELGRSRDSSAVVTADPLDDMVGIVPFSDLVNVSGEVRQLVRSATFLPMSPGAMESLRRVQESRRKLPVVIIEQGETAGIIAIEQLLQEIIGEFNCDARAIERRSHGSVFAIGLFSVHDLKDLGISLPGTEMQLSPAWCWIAWVARLSRGSSSGQRLEDRGV